MKWEFLTFAAALSPAFLPGCTWSNEAVLVDHMGRMHYGIVRFDPRYQTATIFFPGTPYGDIEGAFALVASGEEPVIKLPSIPMLRFSGKAHLGNGAVRFLECDITAEFKSKGMGDMKMIGFGVCRDRESTLYDLSFQ